MKKKTASPEKKDEKTRPAPAQDVSVCTNRECRLRKAGCKGFEACPGFKGR
ncbi:MAG: hypothetical protein WC291_12735 [Thermodesulfovibrionales bacterium]|jgi:hypothetical protein